MGMMTSENQAVKSNALQHKRKGKLPSAQGPFRRLIWGRYVTSQALEERQIAFGESRTSMLQYSTGTNASISRSRSTMSRTATDWTRPADRPGCTRFHSRGEIL